MKRRRAWGDPALPFRHLIAILFLSVCTLSECIVTNNDKITVAENPNNNDLSATTNAVVADSTQSLPSSDATQPGRQPSEPKTPLSTCPRITLTSIIEQLQLNRDTSKCVLTNTIMQETLELPQINYASRECLAEVVSANAEAVKTSAILDDKDNDLYMRNPCEKAAEKFLIIRLCDRLKPTSFEIANMEFFSSAPKNIRVSVSKNYPTFEWQLLGEFEMQNRRDVQSFVVPDGFNYYVKFLKLELLSHYGKEYYCTLSFFRVYGEPAKASENEEPASVTASSPTALDSAGERRFNGSSSSDLANSANTAAIFIEFGKRLTTLEANFKHYGQVIQSIRLLRNETRYLNQENSVIRRHLFSLQRERDSYRRSINRLKVENRRLRQELRDLRDAASTNNITNLLSSDAER